MDPTLAALRTLSSTRIRGIVLPSLGSSMLEKGNRFSVSPYYLTQLSENLDNIKKRVTFKIRFGDLPVCLTQSASLLRCLFAKKSICLAIRLAPTSTFSLEMALILLGRGSMYVR
jgi:hypothetical protein